MASAELSRRVERVVGYPPLSELRRFSAGSPCGVLEASSFEDLTGKSQAGIVTAEQNRPDLRIVSNVSRGLLRGSWPWVSRSRIWPSGPWASSSPWLRRVMCPSVLSRAPRRLGRPEGALRESTARRAVPPGSGDAKRELARPGWRTNCRRPRPQPSPSSRRR